MVQPSLFPDDPAKMDKSIPIGNGYSIEWRNKKVVLVYRYGILFKPVTIKAGIDKRRLVVELILEGGVTKSKLAEALNVSRQSIDNWINTFKKSGFEGLVNSYKGNRRKARHDNFEKIPLGNKARQLEEDRRFEREAKEKRQLLIDFEALQSKKELEQDSKDKATNESIETGAVSIPDMQEGEEEDRNIEEAPKDVVIGGSIETKAVLIADKQEAVEESEDIKEAPKDVAIEGSAETKAVLIVDKQEAVEEDKDIKETPKDVTIEGSVETKAVLIADKQEAVEEDKDIKEAPKDVTIEGRVETKAVLIADKQEAVEEGKEIEDNQKEFQAPDIFIDTYDFQENRYGGSFLYWGIFQYYFNFMGLCKSILGRWSIVIYLFAMMLINKIGSIEQLKTIYKREFGNIIGIKQLYSLPILWKIIHYICKLKGSKLLIEEFFKYQVKNSLVALYWLYIDGHFIPYYGQESVHKGFYTQRDQMMPGQTEMFVHDCHGQIVYFDIQEGKGDLKEMMRRMSAKWSAYIGDIQPLIIADRESWGVEHFLSMKGYRFVTWEKFSEPKELAIIPDNQFGDVFHINNKEYQAFEDKKRYSDDKGNSIELRRIVIWNKSTGKRVACVTQDEEEDTITIAYAMLGRWGCSENSFKHMGKRCNMHYNPLKNASKESELQDIANPEIKKLKKEISEIKKGLATVERQLGRLPLTTTKNGALRKSKKREKLQKKRGELNERLAKAEIMLKNSSERVKLEDVISGKTFKELDIEGKNLWDLAEALVWNSRKKLTQILSEFLPNQRDLIPVLEAITKSRSWIKSTNEVIEIRLEPLDTNRFKAAQIQLCRFLNEKEIRLENGKRLLYDVGPEPENVQKNRR